ncbi:unnamed protein product [Rangifer tarandus platyrhynchus]|uniref:Uncharacterized protein n=1 Tax=Rangifer tarandus platyrhynchus TaxID=3082113 RepID=A0ABN8ZT43_RANTA|nr:unnamed protein product [Rangifer tarandus platyrhynchus]
MDVTWLVSALLPSLASPAFSPAVNVYEGLGQGGTDAGDTTAPGPELGSQSGTSSKPAAAPRCGRDCLPAPTKDPGAALCRDHGTAPRRRPDLSLTCGLTDLLSLAEACPGPPAPRRLSPWPDAPRFRGQGSPSPGPAARGGQPLQGRADSRTPRGASAASPVCSAWRPRGGDQEY